jgi:hypothetical protein
MVNATLALLTSIIQTSRIISNTNKKLSIVISTLSILTVFTAAHKISNN